MANGHSVDRGGFRGGDQKIKGHKVNADLGLEGSDGDDVIIGFGGNDQLVGQDGQDDLSGGADNDLLVGAMWTDDEGNDTDETAFDFNGEVDAEDTRSDAGSGRNSAANGSSDLCHIQRLPPGRGQAVLAQRCAGNVSTRSDQG